MNLPNSLLAHIRNASPDTNLVKLELQLAQYYIDKPGDFKSDQDTIYLFLNRAQQLSIALHSKKWENEILLVKGSYYLWTHDIIHGVSCFMQVIEYYRKQNNKEGEAKTWDRFGDSYDRGPVGLEKKIDCYQHARQLYRAIKEPLNDIQTFKKIADMHMVQGKYDLAEIELLQVLKELKSVNFRNLHYTYDLLASLNKLRGDLHQELFYKLEVVNSMESTGDFKEATSFYYNLATAYYDLHLYKNSLTYYYKALPFSIRDKNYGRYYELLRDIVRVLLDEGEAPAALSFLQQKTADIPPTNFEQREWMDAAYGSCYKELRIYSKAEKYYLDMAKLANNDLRDKNYENYFKNYIIVSDFYISTRNYKRANYYLSKLLDAPSYLIRPSAMSQVQLMQFKVDSASKRWTSAIRHYQLHKKINDSLFNATNKKLLEEVHFRYLSEKKDRDLLLQSKNILLLKKQSQLEQNQVDRTKAIKNVFLGGIFLLTILSAVIYNQYRLKQRSNTNLQEKQKIITDKNTELEKLLIDNEWLLREVHHRVKNNLHIIMSLLHSQSAFLKDEVALNAVMDSQHRVHAMSLIHQKLYKAEQGTTVYMPEYIGELVEYLKQSFKSGPRIIVSMEIEPIYFDVSIAVPVGLILNELITNALKYAFRSEEDGKIEIKLSCPDNETAYLSISDNGCGFPVDFDMDSAQSFGMGLVRGLVEDDLDGEFRLINESGTLINISFDINPLY